MRGTVRPKRGNRQSARKIEERPQRSCSALGIAEVIFITFMRRTGSETTSPNRINSLLPKNPAACLFQPRSNRHCTGRLAAESKQKNDRLAGVLVCIPLDFNLRWPVAEFLLYNSMPLEGWARSANPSAMEGSVSAPDVVWKKSGRFGRAGFGQTRRRDAWWLSPAAVFLGFGAFLVYANWAAFQNSHYTYGPYISPFYSPELVGDPNDSWFGARPTWLPAWVTAAMLILWAPGGFRVTCYYYRGAYYKAFWADPPKHSPLFFVYRNYLYRTAGARCVAWVLWISGRIHGARGIAGAADQRDPSRLLHL